MQIQQIKDIISNLSIDDLKLLRDDLKTQNYTLKLVNEIVEKHEQSNKVCASCGSKIDPFSDNKMVLTFGSQDFERRAHFCAYDCMSYFLERLNKVKQKSKSTINENNKE
jgi:hypothetical protein